MSKRNAALELAASGFRVFPLAINGKTPAITGDWQKVATTDKDKINRLWTDPVFDAEVEYNIGVALDSNTLVVDVDVRGDKRGAKSLKLLEALYGPLPATLTTLTASGGYHLWFKVENSGAFTSNLDPILGKNSGIDLKGEGGYVVAPGSTINGRRYAANHIGDYGGMAATREPESGYTISPLSSGNDDRGSSASAQDDGTDGLGPLGNGVTAQSLVTVLQSGFIEDGRLRQAAPRNKNTPRDRKAIPSDSKTARERAIQYLTNNAPDHGTFKVACHVKDFGVDRDECLSLLLKYWRDRLNLAKDDDHVAFRVNNAYNYGKKPQGIASAEAEFDAVEITNKPAPSRRGLYGIRYSEAKPELARAYLIDDIMDLGAMVVTYGDSNVGKTYVALDQAGAIAAGEPWNGHKAISGLVVYVAAEGGHGFLKRVEAYRRDRKKVDLPLTIVPCPIDLHSTGDAGDTNRLIRLVRAEEAHFGAKCVLLVIDTLARAMGGGDENTAVDMGILVGHCDRLRAALGATVNVIHHTGKDKAKGARGSSALRAATDTEIEVTEGVLSVQKQRDMARVDEMHFELRPVEVGERPDGRKVSACVVDWIAVSEFESRLSPTAQAMLDVLEKLIRARRDAILEDDSLSEDDKPVMLAGVRIPWKEWELSCLSSIVGVRNKPINRRRLFEVRPELCDSGRTKKDAKNQWFIPDSANSAK